MNKKILSAITAIAFSIPAISQTFDPDFGNGGKVTTHLGDENWSNILDVKFLPDGKILTCGFKDVGFIDQIVIARYLQNGILDPDFGNNGLVIQDFGFKDASANQMYLLPEGKFLVVGKYLSDYWNINLTDFMIIRYNADGTIDNSFGASSNGMVTADASGFTKVDEIYSVFIDNNGKIVVAGQAQHDGSIDNSHYYEDFAVARFNSDGTIDNTFGTNGVFKIEIGDNLEPLTGSVDIPYQVKVQTDGKIVLCGISDATSEVERYNLAMIRVNADGTLDQTFGVQGKVLMDLGGIETFRSFHILSDGKYLAVGNSNAGNLGNVKIVRLNSDGSPDITFGNAGVAQSDFDAAGRAGLILDSYLLPDGKILACGAKVGDANVNDIVLRFNTDGVLDDSFGTNGRIEYDFMNADDYAFAIDVNNSGDFVVAGASNSDTNENNDFSIAKFLNQNLSTHGETAINFSVYPNPFTSTLNLNFNLANATVLNADLFDLNGRKITTLFKAFNFASGANTTTFTMPETLAKGMYVLRISDGKNISNIKIIK